MYQTINDFTNHYEAEGPLGEATGFADVDSIVAFLLPVGLVLRRPGHLSQFSRQLH